MATTLASISTQALERQIDCARREVQLRQRVYPKLVKERRMQEHTANQEMAAMEGIVRTLTLLLEARQLELFG